MESKRGIYALLISRFAYFSILAENTKECFLGFCQVVKSLDGWSILLPARVAYGYNILQGKENPGEATNRLCACLVGSKTNLSYYCVLIINELLV